MIKIVGENSTGKTKELIQAAGKETNATIVCSNPMHMKDKAAVYGVYNVKCISYEEFNLQMMTDKTSVFFIDDVDAWLSRMSCNVGGYTLSTD